MLRVALIAVVSSLLLVCSAVAQKPSGPHPLTNLPKSGDVSTGFFFPDHPTKQFPAGELAKVVVGIHNDAAETYNISAIMGSVNHATDFSMYYWNYTQQLYFLPLGPGEEVSLEYTFLPHQDLPPRDYQMALTLFYQTEKNEMLATTFFNQTVDVVEVKRLIDWGLLFLYLLLVAVVGVSVYFLYQWLQTITLFKGLLKGSKKVEVSTKDDDDEWVKGTPYETHKKQRQKTAERAAKKQS